MEDLYVVFECDNFKKALLENKEINPNDNKELLLSKAANFNGEIDVSDKIITSLVGIEAFTELTSLNCSLNQIYKLDISKNKNLTHLYCYDNQIEALDLSSNITLVYLDCSTNHLNQMNISKNMGLKVLDCESNQLSTLDISKNVNLIYLNCEYNQLKTLDLSKNTLLSNFYTICDDKVEKIC